MMMFIMIYSFYIIIVKLNYVFVYCVLLYFVPLCADPRKTSSSHFGDS